VSIGITVLLLAALGATAALAALSLRPSSWLTVGLSAYILLVAETTVLTTALSPLRAVTRLWLIVGEAVLLLIALALWFARRRPTLPRPDLHWRAVRDPGVALLAVAVIASCLYELLLVVSAPPNNWDSLTYHLARAAAWAQHGGVYWIPNPPTDRMNEFQPLAEQQILMLFVATGRSALFALPQFVAGCAAALGVYAVARRLGNPARAAAFAALLFASFPLVALEATTGQNDLVAASLPIVAAALILGGSRQELALSGLALGLAPGVKLTTAFVLPIPLVLALLKGRSTFIRTAVWAVASFIALGAWGFVLNVVHTGHLLGHGSGRLAQQASPSFTGTPTTIFRIVYGFFDLSGLDLGLVTALAALGLVAGAAAFGAQRGRGQNSRAALVSGAAVAAVLALPRLIPVIAHGVHAVANAIHLPGDAAATTGGQFSWGIDFGVHEDFSSFGAVAGLLLLAVTLHQLVNRADRRRQALAAALPLFILLLALTSKYNPWLSRFLLVPVALGAPLLASVSRRRVLSLTIASVVVLQLVLVHVHNELKPLAGAHTLPWSATQADAIRRTFRPEFGTVYRRLRRVPDDSCVGAVVDGDDPSFLLYGSNLSRHVVYLPRNRTPAAARDDGIVRVVLGTDTAVASSFVAAGWSLSTLARDSWRLATAPRSGKDRCAS
jgi:hypothetical protein